jgi:actin-related protein 6
MAAKHPKSATKALKDSTSASAIAHDGPAGDHTPSIHRRLILDLGGCWLRAALVVGGSKGDLALACPPLAIPNAIGASPIYGKGLVGSALLKLHDYHSLMLRRPVDRGFVVDVPLQAHILRCLLEEMKISEEATIDVLLTVPFGAPDAVLENVKSLIFEHFGFYALTLVSASFLMLVARTVAASEKPAAGDASSSGAPRSTSGDAAAAAAAVASRKRGRADATMAADALHDPPLLPAAAAAILANKGTGLVVDCGFSGTTVVPYVDFRPLPESIVRTDVAGKLLTNRLKEVVSFAHLNMLEDQWLINHVKELLCFVAADFRQELRLLQQAKRRGVRRYALPTIPALLPNGCEWEKLPAEVNVTKERDRLQVLALRQELCAVPETLFAPLDGKVPQLALPAAVVAALQRPGTLLEQCRSFLHPPLLHNVILCGGTSALRGLPTRLASELRTLTTRSSSSSSSGAAAQQTDVTVSVQYALLPQGQLGASMATATMPAAAAAAAAATSGSASATAAGTGTSCKPPCGPATLEPLVGGLHLLKHPKLLAAVEQRSRVSRRDALSTGHVQGRPEVTKGAAVMQRAAQLLM